ncbi:MAG: hypothetical protein ACREBC_21480, partial [Pyrinomonadaceae bacterium]
MGRCPRSCRCDTCINRSIRQAQKREGIRPSRAYGTGNSNSRQPNWTPPVHGTTYPEGKPVTAAFGTSVDNAEDTL